MSEQIFIISGDRKIAVFVNCFISNEIQGCIICVYFIGITICLFFPECSYICKNQTKTIIMKMNDRTTFDRLFNGLLAEQGMWSLCICMLMSFIGHTL